MTIEQIKAQLCDVYMDIEGAQSHIQMCLQRKQMLVAQLQEALAKEEKEREEKGNVSKVENVTCGAKAESGVQDQPVTTDAEPEH